VTGTQIMTPFCPTDSPCCGMYISLCYIGDALEKLKAYIEFENLTLGGIVDE
jgi:hypothetical protein